MPEPTGALSHGNIGVLKLLMQALDGANGAGRDKWQFAVAKAELEAAGATSSDLCWLVSQRLVDPAVEVTRPGERERTFHSAADTLDAHVCFVLSHLGKVYLEQNGLAHGAPPAAAKRQSKRKPNRADDRPAKRANGPPEDTEGPAEHAAQPTPQWRPLEGELYFRGERVRRPSRKKARLVEHLLDGFAKAKWARSILNPFDDPGAAREQLKEAVRRLNDSLLIDTLRFHVSRDGMTAWWEDRANTSAGNRTEA